MKIIRLISNDESEADFTNHFNTPILIDGGSKVGLLNLSLVLDDKNIVIDSRNNTFTFKSKKTNSKQKTVTLPTGNYNYGDLENILMSSLNKALALDDLGFMWLPKIVDKKIHLQWNFNQVTIINSLTRENITGDNTNGYVKSGGSSTSWNGWLRSDTPLSEGSTACTFEIAKYVNKTSFVVGLTENDVSKGELLKPDNFYFGVGVSNNNYTIIQNGLVVATTTTPVNNNDKIRISLIGGEYSASVNEVELYKFEKEIYKQSLFVAISFLGNGITIKNVKAILNPFYKQSVNGISYNEVLPTVLENNVVDYTNVGANPGTRMVSIEFPNTETAYLLGFNTLKHEKQANTGSFIAGNMLDDLHIPSSLIVEIPSLDIDSYDGLVSRRQNIIAVIPSLKLEGLNMVYENTNPVMVDIKNAELTNLNLLRARILSINNKPIRVKDNISITLLLS